MFGINGEIVNARVHNLWSARRPAGFEIRRQKMS